MLRNIEACKGLAAITRTSLGPDGMNKLVINHLDKLFITNDAGTIMKELEVAHPAAKLIVMASQMQDNEIGDGTNLVVVLAGELLVQAESLIKQGLHPSDVIAGYTKAGVKAQEILDTLIIKNIKDLSDKAALTEAIMTPLGAKQAGLEKTLAKLVADAATAVMPVNQANFDVDAIRIAKIIGGGVHSSSVINGVVVARPMDGSIHKVKDAKIFVCTAPLTTTETETKGTVLLSSGEELQNYSNGEEARLDNLIASIKAAGANMIVSQSSISDMALHFIEKHGLAILKVQSKFELRRLCKTIGATPLVEFKTPTPDDLGSVAEVELVEVGGARITVFRRSEDKSRIATIIVRASTQNVLDDIERALDNGINNVKAITRDGSLLPGGAAAEIEISRQLQTYGEKAPGMDQYSIVKFAEALDVVARTLAENAGFNSTDVISNLYAAHAAGKVNAGLDVNDGNATKDMKEAGVLDLAITKKCAIRLAVDAAVTVLKVDQIIMAKQAGGPKARPAGPMDQD